MIMTVDSNETALDYVTTNAADSQCAPKTAAVDSNKLEPACVAMTSVDSDGKTTIDCVAMTSHLNATAVDCVATASFRVVSPGVVFECTVEPVSSYPAMSEQISADPQSAPAGPPTGMLELAARTPGLITGSSSNITRSTKQLSSCSTSAETSDDDPVIRPGVLAANSSIPVGGPAGADFGSADICSYIAG